METNKYRKQEAVRCALIYIKQNGGEMRVADVFSKMAAEFPESAYEQEKTKSGTERWFNWLSFYSIDAVKAGFLLKEKGIWHITAEGENILCYDLETFAKALKSGYDKWKDANVAVDDGKHGEDESDSAYENIELDAVQIQANKGIRDYICKKNPYEFQDVVAALFRAMGYYTPFVAPKGKDGGVDIIAYKDPLGTMLPRVKVQVKHYPGSTISVNIVRSLIGVLQKEGDTGVVVTSGTFTADAKREARNSHTPVRLIDIDEFISLWLQYYPNMSEEDKTLMPILPVYFIKPNNAANI